MAVVEEWVGVVVTSVDPGYTRTIWCSGGGGGGSYPSSKDKTEF